MQLGPISVKWRYIVVFLVAALGLTLYRLLVEGLAAPNTHDWGELVLHLAEEAFVAGVAALLIAFLLETPSREETAEIIRKEIKDNTAPLISLAAQIGSDAKEIEEKAFKRAFRRNFPRTVFAAIENQILCSKYIMRQRQAVWELKVKEIAGERRVEAEVDTSFDVINITDEAQAYEPQFNIDDRSDSSGETATISAIEINGNKEDPSKFVLTSDGWYEFPAQQIPKGGSVSIQMIFKFRRYMNDHELWSSAYPSESMTLRIKYPAGGKPDPTRNEFFNIDIMGKLPFRRTKGPDWVNINIPGTVLPHQGILMHWRFNRDPLPQLPTSVDEAKSENINL
jgi:hypothetical protein